MGNKLQNLKTISEDLHPRAKKSFRVSGNCKSQMLCVLLIMQASMINFQSWCVLLYIMVAFHLKASRGVKIVWHVT